MSYDYEEALLDAQRLAAFLNRLADKYGDDLNLIADDPYCTWATAGFFLKPSTGKARTVSEAFRIRVEKEGDQWKVSSDEH